MPTFTIPGTTIAPGAERHSPGQTLTANINSIVVQLTDPNNVWNTTVGNIIAWGVQKSTDGGTTWSYVISQPLAFGSRDKSGGMPSLGLSGSQLQGLVNDQLRLAITVDTSIFLGATITVN